MTQNIKSITTLFKIITLVLFIFAGANLSYAVNPPWTNPTATFPNNNTAAPIHVGTKYQSKGTSIYPFFQNSTVPIIESEHFIGRGSFFSPGFIIAPKFCIGDVTSWASIVNGQTGNCITSWPTVPPETDPVPGTLNHTIRYNGTAWESSGLMQNDSSTISILRNVGDVSNPGDVNVGMNDGFQLVKKAFAQMTQNNSADLFRAQIGLITPGNGNPAQRGLTVDSTGRTVLTGDLISFSPSYFFKDVTLGAESGVFANLPINLKVFGNSQFGSDTVPREVRVKGGVFVNNLEHNTVLYPNEAPVCATAGGRLVLCPPPAPINMEGQMSDLPYWMYDDSGNGGTWFPYNINSLSYNGVHPSGTGTVMGPDSYYDPGNQNIIDIWPKTCQEAFNYGVSAYNSTLGSTTTLPHPTLTTVPLSDIRASVSVDGGTPVTVTGKCYYITGIITATSNDGFNTVTYAPKIELLPATTQGLAIGAVSITAGNFTGTLSSGYTQGPNHTYQWKSEIQIHP